ncbi:MAG: cadherin-like domain-containing protein [Halothiobacillaceae bacterium]
MENVNDPGEVTIDGTEAAGFTLTTTLSDGDGLLGVTPTYQWYRSDTVDGTGDAIDGATHSAYTLTNDDGDKYVRVEVSYTDEQGTAETADAVTSGPVQKGPVAPVAVDDTDSVTEDSGVDNGTLGSGPATGNVFDNDTDENEGDTQELVEVRKGDVEGTGFAGTESEGTWTVDGQYGTLEMESDGSYTYTLDQSNTAVEALNSGDTLTDSFNYTLKDSTSLTDIGVLEITVNGANDKPTLETAPAATSTVQEDFATLLDASLSVSDPDGGAGDDFQIRFSVDDGRLSTDGGGGLTVKGDDTGVLTLIGDMDSVNAYIKGDVISYTTSANASGTNVDTLTVEVDDGSGFRELATQQIDATPTNDAAVVDLGGDTTEHGTEFTTTFRPRGEAVQIVDDSVKITDVDSGDGLTGGSVSIATGALDNQFGDTFETLKSTAGSSFTAPSGAVITINGNGTPTLTLSGDGTHADYEALLKTIVYENANPNAYSGDRTVSVALIDDAAEAGSGATASNTASFKLASANTAVAVGQKIFIDGVDSGHVVAAVAGDDQNITASGVLADLEPDSSLTFETTVAVETDISNATSFDMEAANDSVAEGMEVWLNGSNTNETVTGVSGKTITTSGNLTLIETDVVTLRTTATNDAPLDATTTVQVPWTTVVDVGGEESEGNDHAVTYTEQETGVAIAASTASLDNQSINIKTMTIDLTNATEDTDESLTIAADVETLLKDKGISVAGKGTHTITVSADDPSEGATAADMQLALRAVTYANASDDPSVTPRTADVSVVDVNDTRGVDGTTTITVVPVNDAPVVDINTGAGDGSGANPREGGGVTLTSAMLAATDVDDADESLTYTVTGDTSGDPAVSHGTLFRDGNNNEQVDSGEILTVGARFTQADINAELLKYRHDGSNTTSDHFDFKVEDGMEDGVTAPTGTFNFSVTPVNDAPTLTATASDPTFSEEDGTAVGLFSDSSAATGEGTDQTLDELVITISNVSDTGKETLTVDGTELDITGDSTATGVGSYSADVSFSNGTATVTVDTSGADAEAIQNLVDGLQYNNTSSAPTPLNRVITLSSIKDSGGTEHGGSDTGSPAITSTVTIDADDAEPTPENNNGATLDEGAVHDLSNSELSYDDTDTEATDITYTLTSVTANGTLFIDANDNNLVDSGEALAEGDTFTQDDIDTANTGLEYRHDGSETTSDSFSFTVGDGTTTLAEDTFAFTVTPLNDAPTLTATGENPTALDGSETLFSGAAASAVESDQELTDLTLTVSGLKDGADEILSVDGTDVALTDGTNGTTGGDANIDYDVSVNDSIATVTLSNGTLDGDQAAALVEGLAYKNTADTASQGLRVATITKIVDDGGTANGGFDTTSPLGLSSTVNVGDATNTAPTWFAKSIMNLYEGGLYTLKTTNLSAEDDEQPNSSLIYTLDSAVPTEGTLFRDADGDDVADAGEVLSEVGDSFVQADVVNGLIKYQHHGAEFGDPLGFNITASDGLATTDPAWFNIAMFAVNDAPTLSATADDPTFDEATGTAVGLFSDSAIDPIETDQDILMVQFEVTGLADGADEVVVLDGKDVALTNENSGTTTDNGFEYMVSVSAGTATVMVGKSGGDTPAAFQELLDGLAYRNDSEAPTGANRTVTLQGVQDDGDDFNGGQDSTTVSIASTVGITTSDSAPSLNPADDPSLPEGGALTLTTDYLNASDPDTALADLTYTLATAPGTGEVRLDGTAMAEGDTFTHADLTGGKVVYHHDGSETFDPSFGISVSDGTASSNEATLEPIITPVNDPPVIGALDGTSVDMTANKGASLIDAGGVATISDVDSEDFDGGNLTVEVTGYHSAAYDVLGIENQGTDAGQIGVSGADVSYGGTQIGTLTGGSGSQPLVVALDGDASKEAVQALTRAITFEHTQGEPADDTRTVSFSVSDGDGGAQTSAPANVTINLADGPVTTADNEAPKFNSATVSGSRLVMAFSDDNPLDDQNLPGADQFTVQVDGSGVTVDSVAVDSNARTVTLTLSSAVRSEQSVTVSYRDDSAGDDVNAIQDQAGNDVATFSSAEPVANITPEDTGPTPQPDPEPDPEEEEEETTTTTVDGVTVTTTTTVSDDGTTTTTTSVPIVTDDREDEIDTTPLADIPLVTEEDGDTLVQASLPVGVGITSQGVTGGSAGTLRELLIAASNPKIEEETVFDEILEAGIDSYVPTVQDEKEVTVRTLTFESTGTVPDQPILVTGATGTGEDDADHPQRQEALVMDARDLPSGTVLQFDKVEFAIVIGAVQVEGGEGRNFVIGDDAAQYIVLGADDDILHGGAGDDTIGSKGGDDRLFGGDGNDTLFGGTGHNLLHGGKDTDVITYEGQIEDYVITRDHGKTIVTSRTDPEMQDTLINAELIRFSNQDYEIENSNELSLIATLYWQVLDRQPELGGFQYWSGEAAAGQSLGSIAMSFLRSVEKTSAEGQEFEDLPAEDQIESLYTHFLGRASDEGGMTYWLEQLNGGMAIEDIAGGFVYSDELAAMQLNPTDWDFLL